MGGACLTSVNNAVHSRRPGAESQHQRASGTHPSRSDQSRSPHGPNADPSALPNRPFDTSHLGGATRPVRLTSGISGAALRMVNASGRNAAHLQLLGPQLLISPWQTLRRG